MYRFWAKEYKNTLHKEKICFIIILYCFLEVKNDQRISTSYHCNRNRKCNGDVLTSILSYAPLVLVIIAFYFLLIRPQQKKDKEDKAMRENLDIGDEIVTAGGIIGRIVSIKDDTIVIETGSDRSKIRITKWAVSQNITAAEAKNKDKA